MPPPGTRRSLLAAAAFLGIPMPRAGSAVPGPLFGADAPRSVFMGGFECSAHRRADGRRLDLLAATRHDVLARQDYHQLTGHGIRAARDGVRWHLVEPGPPGRYDWSSFLPMLRAAEAEGMRVAWDLCHYGWPDGLDVFSAAFVDRLSRYAAAFARLHVAETGRAPVTCPVNEISFLAWAGGDMGRMNPATRDRGGELKLQLVRAAIAATRAAQEAVPGTRVLTIEPVIHIAPLAGQDPAIAASHVEAAFQAWDMIAGRVAPDLGGTPELLDVVGVNYYWNNQWLCTVPRRVQEQWLCDGEPISAFDPRARPLRSLLADVHRRYLRPVLIAETSIEGDHRAAWLRHVCAEARAAMTAGVPLEGVCLYPVLSHPGWDDDRYCPNGLLEMEVQAGRRVEHAPLAAELRRQTRLFEAVLAGRDVDGE